MRALEGHNYEVYTEANGQVNTTYHPVAARYVRAAPAPHLSEGMFVKGLPLEEVSGVQFNEMWAIE